MDEDHNGMHADDGSDDDDDALDRGSCVLSQNTLNKLASGEDIGPSDLSPEEKKAFLRAVAKGEFSHMIKPWEPWWLSPFVKKIALNKEGNRVVQPVESTDAMLDNANEIFDVPPPLDSPLPPLKQLTSKLPSPLLGVHLVEVLYSYCFTLRFYNGDWVCDAFDAAWTCLSVSHVLQQSAIPQTVGEALNSCFEIVCSPLFKSAGGYKFALALLDDVAALLHVGRAGGICALSELHRLLNKAVKDTKQGDGNTIRKGHLKLDLSREPVKTKASTSSDLKAACKKVFFLLCWTNEQPAEIFSSLALLIETEKAHIVGTCEPSVLESNNRRGSDTSNNRKSFVEEIN